MKKNIKIVLVYDGSHSCNLEGRIRSVDMSRQPKLLVIDWKLSGSSSPPPPSLTSPNPPLPLVSASHAIHDHITKPAKQAANDKLKISESKK